MTEAVNPRPWRLAVGALGEYEGEIVDANGHPIIKGHAHWVSEESARLIVDAVNAFKPNSEHVD